jgi:hypothetical protein
MRRWRVFGAMIAAASVVLAGCASRAGTPDGDVGFLGAATAQSPREDGLATVQLSPAMTGANLLVAIAMGDGPGPGEPGAQTQHTRLSDSVDHAWALREHHLVFGSIIDVYTAPATGREPGSTITSELTIKQGDEGHSLTVLAYRHGRFASTTARNGGFGIPQLTQHVPAGTDVLTAFGDGRENTPATPVPGFQALNVLPVDGGPRGDRDLYQLSRLEPPGSWPGGAMLTGNLAPPASGYWGLVDINIAPDT